MAPNRPLTPIDIARASLEAKRKLREQDGGPLSDFGESIPARMDHILKSNTPPDFSDTVMTNNGTPAPTDTDGDSHTSINADHHNTSELPEDSISHLTIDRSRLCADTSTIDLIIREPMEDISYPVLIYVGESGATDNGVRLLKFIDPKTKIAYTWNGEQGEGGAIRLGKGVIKGTQRTYYLCPYPVTIVKVTY